MLAAAPLRDTAVAQWLASELAGVECRFTAAVVSDLPCVNQLVGHIERYRGKMLRPTLLLASGLACRPQGQDLSEGHRLLATVVEMVHMATLVHDDILDEAQVRRRGATINALAGNETAVMLGDYLFSHAYRLCSRVGRPDLTEILVETTNIVCEGEVLQLANRNNWDLDEPTYFEIIRRKTASLCGASCQLGAMLSGAPPEQVSHLQAYGEHLGVTFQIVDDLLDLTGDQATVGKTLGRDLQKGKLTLPLIHHLQVADATSRRELLNLLGAARALDETDAAACAAVARIPPKLRDTGSLDYAHRAAERVLTEAKAQVQGLKNQEVQTYLFQIADSILNRKY